MVMRKTVSLAGLLFCVACGGGGGGGGNPTVDDYVMFLDPASTGTAALSSITLSGATVASGDDDLDGSDISVGGLSGQFNSTRDMITFTIDGGSATIVGIGTTYVALVDARPLGTDPFRAIIGVPTLSNDLPTDGSIDYAGIGSARFVIIDADEGATFALTADTDVGIDFDNNLVTMTFDNLDGTKTVGTAAAVEIDDLGTLMIEDAVYQDGAFSGGTADFIARVYNDGGNDVSDITGRLSGSEIVTTAGALFGPNADELAGIIYIDDTGDALLISGIFTAD